MTAIFWLRDEVKAGERRTPLTPTGAAELMAKGAKVYVERSSTRIIPDDQYEAVGCELVETHSWPNAPKDAFILGLKELEVQDFALTHRHIYFAHAFKGQDEAPQIMGRFREGQGEILDLEFLQDENGRRVSAFGYWAGYVGAAVGFAGYAHRQHSETPFPAVGSYPDQETYIAELKQQVSQLSEKPRVLVIGARGRCGTGAVDLFKALDIEPVMWDMEETAKGGPFVEINDFDIMVNCAYLAAGTPPFVTAESLGVAPRISMISDVSCDPNNIDNPIRIYSESTKLTKPIIESEVKGVEVQAVDHLPTVLPKESSEDFSSQLFPHLVNLAEGEDPQGVWARAQNTYQEALLRVK